MSIVATFVLLLIFLIGTIVLVLIFNHFYRRDTSKSPYYPFAYLPPINISQEPQLLSNSIISQLAHTSKTDPNEFMVAGQYQRYPLNKNKQTTSIVAVEPNQNYFPYFIAWGIEVDINAWNFLWCDSDSSYFITPINVVTSPVVVIKGQFPRARYMSIYSYCGPQSSTSNDILFGQGITSDGLHVCNPSNTDKKDPTSCEGLRDIDIKPDHGSKNPFVENCNDDDEMFYTIYLISPNYSGPRPDPKHKNIINLNLYGAEIALIVYRIYSTFNPKSCSSGQYWSKSYFDTMGCPKDKQLVDTKDGGAVYPYLDNRTPQCSIGDKVCIQECIQYKLGHSGLKECRPFLGQNLYCVCNDKNNKCYAEIDKITRECSKNLFNVDKFCANAPNKTVSQCIDDVQCSPDDKICLRYVDRSKLQNCVGGKLLASTDPMCDPYKDPNSLCKICDGITRDTPDDDVSYTPCQKHFRKYLKECDEKLAPGYISDISGMHTDIKKYCNLKCPGNEKSLEGDISLGLVPPPYAYNPEYDFNMKPVPSCSPIPQCTDENCRCDKKCTCVDDNCRCDKKCTPRYDCDNGYCVEKQDGRYTSPDCDQHCPYHASTNTPRHRIPIREMFEPSGKPCMFGDCDLEHRKYKDIDKFGNNSIPAAKLFRQGWVGLPSVFVKYSFNNYFIKLNNWNLQKLWKLSAYFALEPTINHMRNKNPAVPSVKENFIHDEIERNAQCMTDILEGNATEDSVNCFPTPEDWSKDIDKDKIQNEIKDQITQCDKYIGTPNYFYIGAQFPVGKRSSLKVGENKNDQPTKSRTYKSTSPYCNYYADLCRCRNSETTLNNCCESALGRLTCTGENCFSKWGYGFNGSPEPFIYAANTGKVIPFPNPDVNYIGCCTSFNENEVYVIWMDIPTFPHTPGYDTIIKKNYDLRYFSVGHYYYNMTVQHPKPVLSDVVDAEMKVHRVKYQDGRHGRRVCIVLCTEEQQSYMLKFKLWSDKITWLNWGKLPPSLPSVTDILEKRGDRLVDEIGDGNIRSQKEAVSSPIVKSQTPQKGFLIYRQLFPNKRFKEAIANFKNSSCLNGTKDAQVLDKFEQNNMEKSKTYPHYCNPGPGMVQPYDALKTDQTQSICDAYGFDPCCLSRDLLNHCKNYYPRCEKVRLCDVQREGTHFWKKYFENPLPYQPEPPQPPPPQPPQPPQPQPQPPTNSPRPIYFQQPSPQPSYSPTPQATSSPRRRVRFL